MGGLLIGEGDATPNGLPRCPDCGEVLSRHQPDPHEPGKLLGTCDVCQADGKLGWFRVSGATGAVTRLVAGEG
jgi:hypothetical protein